MISKVTLTASLLQLLSPRLPLQVSGVHGLVADGALGPALVAKRQVVEDARPAEDVSAPCDASCHRRIEADGARRHLMAVDALSTHRKYPPLRTLPLVDISG